MTLFKQATALFVSILLFILGVVLLASFEESREYIEEELFAKAQNTASALGVAMSQSNGDIAKMSVMASAAFDTGYYKSIILKNMRGETLFEKRSERKGTVPSWFLEYVDIPLAKGVAQVSSGWKPLGLLEVVSDESLAYEYLYTLFKKILSIFIFAIIVGAIFIFFGLKILLRPIEGVRKQAEEVLKNSFKVNNDIPKTFELRMVTEAVNGLVAKMKFMHDKLIDITAKNRSLEYKDQLTGLCNRRFFLLKYNEYIWSKLDRCEECGYVVLFRLYGVEEANSIVGYDRVNEIFKSFANRVQLRLEKVSGAHVCRVSGVEMAILIPNEEIKRVMEITKEVLNGAKVDLESNEDLKKILYISAAVCKFDAHKNHSRIFATLDLALKLAQGKRFFVEQAEFSESGLPVRKDEWISLAERAIDDDGFGFSLFEVLDKRGVRVSNKVAFNLFIKEGENVDERIYLPMLNGIGLFERYARMRFERVLRSDEIKPGKLLMEFPFSYLDTTHTFYEAIGYIKKLRGKGIELVPQIWQGDLLRSDAMAINRVFENLSSNSVSVALKGFDADPAILDLLNSIRPVLVSIQKEYFEDIKEHFRESIYLLLQSIGAQIIVEDDFNKSSTYRKSFGDSVEFLYIKKV